MKMKRLFGTTHNAHEYFRVENFERNAMRFKPFGWIFAEHEKEHADEAAKLGYTPFFKIDIEKTYFFGKIIGARVVFRIDTLEEMADLDRAQIALAPTVPSIPDLNVAQACGRAEEASILFLKHYARMSGDLL